ncbi:thiamine biosynthesis protein ThiJ [Paenibacillus glucanolyticus]|uniref:Thiamine biosynthesis protein ThiJ n=1 Tax=Paenibacillus glucanolyticus TaxID=59843 RepID=A0A163INE6_9BACL|nr:MULTISPECIES: DJ-1/PfpI family protein [Paenibacillus]AWP30489.1 thiamine biosynthesis protein ThiJ [Paenibacillus sp. Cedars]KZS46051.1 thiamine biosynthesis protein ThiJ [Paenibacillus glucanolyticus]
MKMAFILFHGMTALDLIGFTEVITRLSRIRPEAEVSWDYCAMTSHITDDRGLEYVISRVKPDLSKYELVFVPGGFATRKLRQDSEVIAWLQTAREAKYLVSVCTGSLLLGAAGLLEGKRATSNASAYDLLAPYCKEVVQARIVRDGRLITGGGVSSSIDLGLFMLERLTDAPTVELVKSDMSYPYYQTGTSASVYHAMN